MWCDCTASFRDPSPNCERLFQNGITRASELRDHRSLGLRLLSKEAVMKIVRAVLIGIGTVFAFVTALNSLWMLLVNCAADVGIIDTFKSFCISKLQLALVLSAPLSLILATAVASKFARIAGWWLIAGGTVLVLSIPIQGKLWDWSNAVPMFLAGALWLLWDRKTRQDKCECPSLPSQPRKLPEPL
jgi:hypothetical protein